MLGAATCPVSNCYDLSLATVQRALAGVNGDVTLATIELYSDSPGEYELVLDHLQLVDPQGEVLPVQSGKNWLVVKAKQ